MILTVRGEGSRGEAELKLVEFNRRPGLVVGKRLKCFFLF